MPYILSNKSSIINLLFLFAIVLPFTCPSLQVNNKKLLVDQLPTDTELLNERVIIKEKDFNLETNSNWIENDQRKNAFNFNLKNVADYLEGYSGNDTFIGRTFGGLRRLKIAIPAIMYKLGVVTTMLGVLTALALKGVTIGIVMLILQLSAGISKIIHKKTESWDHQEGNFHGKIPQNIHVHVHGTGTHGYYTKYPATHSGHHSSSFWDRNLNLENNNNNLHLLYSNSNNDLTYQNNGPYMTYTNTKISDSSKLDEILNRLKGYNELKSLRDLRDSLYQQVI